MAHSEVDTPQSLHLMLDSVQQLTALLALNDSIEAARAEIENVFLLRDNKVTELEHPEIGALDDPRRAALRSMKGAPAIVIDLDRATSALQPTSDFAGVNAFSAQRSSR